MIMQGHLLEVIHKNLQHHEALCVIVYVDVGSTIKSVNIEIQKYIKKLMTNLDDGINSYYDSIQKDCVDSDDFEPSKQQSEMIRALSSKYVKIGLSLEKPFSDDLEKWWKSPIDSCRFTTNDRTFYLRPITITD